MTAKKRNRLKATPGGRFDPRTIGDRMEFLRDLAGVEPKNIGTVIWPGQTQDNAARAWYRRTSEKPRPFTLPELEVGLDHLLAAGRKKGTITAAKLPGYPFVDYWISIAIEHGDFALTKRNH